MAQHDHTVVDAHGEHVHEDFGVKRIWQVFGILLFLTAIEFLVALGFVHHWGLIHKGLALNIFYIVLTIIKAYYIVAYFMHLKFEKKGFILSCLVVFAFIIYFIILILLEGHFLLGEMNHQPVYPNK